MLIGLSMGESINILIKKEYQMKLLMLLAGVMSCSYFCCMETLILSDYVGVSFWLVTAALLAATVFFFARKRSRKRKMENLINMYLVWLLVSHFGTISI